MKKLWETQYKDAFDRSISPSQHNPTPSIETPNLNRMPKHRDPNDFDQFLNPPNFYTNQQAPVVDEYKEYLKIPAAPCERPLSWWQSRYDDWPNLTRIALDVLLIPLMSAECERIFSAAGYLINRRRSHLKENIIKASTCLRTWDDLE